MSERLLRGSGAALDSVSLSVSHGAQIAVVGPMGPASLDTLQGHDWAGLLEAWGRCSSRRPASEYRYPVAYVPQREEVDWRFPVTVSDVVSMGRYGRGRWFRRRRASDLEIARQSMERLDIAALAERPIGELSGGQQQRVFLARALAQEPHVLLLDEPFTGVDISTKEAVLGLLSSLRERPVTVLVSTHDLELASARFDEIVLLNGGLISSGSPRRSSPRNICKPPSEARWWW